MRKDFLTKLLALVVFCFWQGLQVHAQSEKGVQLVDSLYSLVKDANNRSNTNLMRSVGKTLIDESMLQLTARYPAIAAKYAYTFCVASDNASLKVSYPVFLPSGLTIPDSLVNAADSVLWYKVFSLEQHRNNDSFYYFDKDDNISARTNLVNPGRIAELAYNSAVLHEHGLCDEDGRPYKFIAMAMYELAASKTGMYAAKAKEALNDFKLGTVKFKKQQSANTVHGILGKMFVFARREKSATSYNAIASTGRTQISAVVLCPLSLDKEELKTYKEKIGYPYTAVIAKATTGSAVFTENEWWKKPGITAKMTLPSLSGVGFGAKIVGNKIMISIPTKGLTTRLSTGQIYMANMTSDKTWKWVTLATIVDDGTIKLCHNNPAIRNYFGDGLTMHFAQYQPGYEPDYQWEKTDMTKVKHKLILTDKSKLIE